MKNDWLPTADHYKTMIDRALEGFFRLPESDPMHGFAEAARYSLLAGGKRVRAMLVLEFCRISGGRPESALDLACGVEMLHAYSLSFAHPRTGEKMAFQAPLPGDFLKGLKQNGITLP